MVLEHIILKSDGTSMAEGKDMSTILDEIYIGINRISDPFMN
jgi:hypothetical protein